MKLDDLTDFTPEILKQNSFKQDTTTGQLVLVSSETPDYTKTVETLKLAFLNLGPSLINLNLPFTKLTTLYLQHNSIQKLEDDCFKGMPSIKFLAL